MKKNRMFNFLIEMLLVIVFFALSMIVVVNIFGHGNILADKTAILNKAHSTYISILEKMKEYDGENLDAYLSNYDLDEYNIEVSVSGDDMYTSEVKIVYDGEVLRSIEVVSAGDTYE